MRFLIILSIVQLSACHLVCQPHIIWHILLKNQETKFNQTWNKLYGTAYFHLRANSLLKRNKEETMKIQCMLMALKHFLKHPYWKLQQSCEQWFLNWSNEFLSRGLIMRPCTKVTKPSIKICVRLFYLDISFIAEHQYVILLSRHIKTIVLNSKHILTLHYIENSEFCKTCSIDQIIYPTHISQLDA